MDDFTKEELNLLRWSVDAHISKLDTALCGPLDNKGRAEAKNRISRLRELIVKIDRRRAVIRS